MSPLDPSLSSFSRRQFCLSLSAAFFTQLVKVKDVGPGGSFGISTGSFPIRTRQASYMADPGQSVGIPAEKFIDLCKSFGGDGCQMDLDQLNSSEDSYLKRIRSSLEDKGMFLELSLKAELLDNLDGLAAAAAVSKELGVSRLRLAVNGRRYEEFSGEPQWREHSERWLKKLQAAEPVLKQHNLRLGVENHKDWLADEQVSMLKTIDSPHIGACVDFGNNLALLEEPVEVAQKLAPYAVTSHLKDVMVAESEDGFLLAEVPLGQGILPLAKIMEILRRGNSAICFCLEMITRDPLKVPCRQDQYWATFGGRQESRLDKFKSLVLSKATTKPLPRISGMSSARMQAVEDDNIRRSSAYAKRTLGL
jgi:3-oxoisoapionate decarboxylase